MAHTVWIHRRDDAVDGWKVQRISEDYKRWLADGMLLEEVINVWTLSIIAARETIP
ncbi:MAG: hypothetical protein HYR77_01825 [Ignavibacteria bacterium]|nr:hypothetical protein [Ignavibacteria bacterium]